MVTGVKFSQIASGGAVAPSTDKIVTVRSGNTDVLTDPGVPYSGATGDVDLGVHNIAAANIGTAAAKTASDNSKTNVASVSGATVGGHIAIFNDTAGTVTDGGATSGTITPQVLTWGSTVAWDLSLGTNATLTATSNIPFTLSNPTNLVAGMEGFLTIKQFSTGGQVITWGSAYKFPLGNKFTLSVSNNAVDTISWYTPDGTTVQCSGLPAFS